MTHQEEDTSAVHPQGWSKGGGWGWIWGDEDEIGALNSLTPQAILGALRGVEKGHVYDLGVAVNRASYLSPLHPHTEMLLFRTPEGTKRQQDIPMMDPRTNTAGLAFMSGLVIICDHAGTQIDGLGHITTGEDNHWYNGYTCAENGGDFGPRKASADTTPPIISRGILIDIAGSKKVEVLPNGYAITSADLKAALDWQGTTIDPGNVVLVRTGTLGRWKTAGEDHEALRGPDRSGLTLEAARWLVEEHGAMLVGSDTTMVEVFPNVDGKSWHPVHEYLLIEQGVHMGELHFLEDLAHDRVYSFCYIALVPKIIGLTAGFAMRPIAIV